MGGFWNGSFRYSITHLSMAVAAALSISGMLFKACCKIATKSDLNDIKKELRQNTKGDLNDIKKELKQDINCIDSEIKGINESHKKLATLKDIKNLLDDYFKKPPNQ